MIRTVPRVGFQMASSVHTEDNNQGATALRAGGDRSVSSPVQQPSFKVRYATSRDGSTLAWASEGDGPPLIRAGHWLTHLDLDRSSQIWGPWLHRLGARRRLVRYDLRGTGMSDPDCGPFNLDAFAEDMLAVADAAGLETFSIFAASNSVAVSLAVAVRHPDRVTRIVSCGGYAQGASVRDGGKDAAMAEAMEQMIRNGWGQADSGFMHALTSMFAPGASDVELHELIQMQQNSTDAERAVHIREVIAKYDVTDLLERVPCPVLIVHSLRDSLHPFSQARLLARHLPDSEMLPLDSPNHILLPGEPAFARMMDAVDAFLSA
ncbi:alpha/beta hydrolase [Thalassovita aquimarina]|uniref:alpha/beta fold hydrolase n=1 Tax=Thalassovita aquimarina TaxID=2785917 RepID=UPI0031B9D044